MQSRQVQLGAEIAEPGQSQQGSVPEKVPGGFGAKPGQVQQVSGEGSGESRGGFGAEPRQVQQGSGEGSGEGLGGFGAARSGSTGFRRSFHRLASQHASERFVRIKRCGCWGYLRSLFTHKLRIFFPNNKILLWGL